MKTLLIAILTFSTVAIPQTKGVETDRKMPLQAVSCIVSKEGEQAFEIVNGEARPDKDIIREFVVKDYVTVSYKNATTKTLTPQYTLRIYNQYGFMLAEKKVQPSMLGGSPRLEPDDVGAEKILIDWIPVDKIFEHSRYLVPDDFAKPKWVSVSLSNTKIEPAGAAQPATKPADKVPAKVQPPTPTSKDGPR